MRVAISRPPRIVQFREGKSLQLEITHTCIVAITMLSGRTPQPDVRRHSDKTSMAPPASGVGISRGAAISAYIKVQASMPGAILAISFVLILLPYRLLHFWHNNENNIIVPAASTFANKSIVINP